MLKRLALKKGDTIGVLSTARWVEKEVIENTETVLRSWGLNPVFGETMRAKYNQFAGDDNLRAKELQSFLDNPEIKAILCARGGYGTLRIIDAIDFTQFMLNPKLICGFSDITVLLNHITDKIGIPTLHSAMAINFSTNSNEALNSLRNFLFGETPTYLIDAHPLNKIGSAQGKLMGGNLSILYALLGTKYGFSTRGKILFLEDVDEYLYHIDRMMMSLKLAGKLDNIAGLIVGGLSDMKDNTIPFGKTAEEIILEHVNHLNIPICFQFPAGHQQDNRALLFGKTVELNCDEAQVVINYK